MDGKGKGKAKITKTMAKYRGIFPAVDSQWRPECSRRNDVQAKGFIDMMDCSSTSKPVTVKEDLQLLTPLGFIGINSPNLSQSMGLNGCNGPHLSDQADVSREKVFVQESLRDCNRRLSESLVSIFRSASSSMGFGPDPVMEKDGDDVVESDLEEFVGPDENAVEDSVSAHVASHVQPIFTAELTQHEEPIMERAEEDAVANVLGQSPDLNVVARNASVGLVGHGTPSLRRGKQVQVVVGRGVSWKKRARAGFVPSGVTTNALEEFQKRRDGPILFSSVNIKRPKFHDVDCKSDL
ncbi:MAG: hypothetical protein Q8754_02585 [Sweet potato little leaf phytoplasma]|nr:hypothetical protein [Sweet potato little leaf phytoplasma]